MPFRLRPPSVAELDPQVITICDRCDRLGQHRRSVLVERHGADVSTADLLIEIAKEAGCTRAVLGGSAGRCGLRFLGLRQRRTRSNAQVGRPDLGNE